MSDVDDDGYDYQWQSDSAEETSPEAELLGALVLLGIVLAAERAAPHLKRWWRESAAPLGRRVKRTLSRSRTPESAVDTAELEAVTVVVPAAQAGSPDVVEALAEYRRATMSTAEARDRLVAALVARMFADQQLRVLRDARIGDDDPAVALLDAVEKLTPEQLTASLQSMLALDPTSSDAATLTQLFDRLSTGDSDRVSLPRSYMSPARRDT